ncbi:protein kinase [Pendulispora rubella]|uniref:Protein kinase n=1 Tax=Pendulispora rubella TaxID=2741070 RepID=A0ABZ2LLJ1_9BACT
MNAPVQVGDILASKYRVESVLGAGAMGVVVAARHVQLGSLVALKFMLPDTHRVHGASDRFIREARAAARLRGEHVARVMDFGTLETGAAYIVMEFLEGQDLEAVMDARGRLPMREAIDYVIDVCKAMDEAHRAGIIHRDLKPKNLFLTHRPDGTPLVKVLDFGVSKVSDAADDLQVSTRAGAILGSPAFMSPEQIRGSKDVDARTDIYAIGIVLFYLLTKQFPFEAESLGDLYGAVLYKEPHPLRTLRPELPAALEAVVSRCLHKDAAARFATAKELMVALSALLAPSGPIAQDMAHVATVADVPRAPGSSSPAMVPAQGTLSHAAMFAADATGGKRKRAPLVLLAVAAVAALAVLAAGALSLRTRAPKATAPPLASAEATIARSAEPVVPVATPSLESVQPAPNASTAEDASARPSSRPKADAGAKKPHTPGPNLPHGELYE